MQHFRGRLTSREFNCEGQYAFNGAKLFFVLLGRSSTFGGENPLLPPFDEFGNLPAGIHRCGVDELVARFGRGSPEREVETRELLDFIAWARTVDIRRIIINGSYVTALTAPNDVDIVILAGPNCPPGTLDWLDQDIRWPFLQILVAADEADLIEWSLGDFGTDRAGHSKGVVEVCV